jgi:hypothetical protein
MIASSPPLAPRSPPDRPSLLLFTRHARSIILQALAPHRLHALPALPPTPTFGCAAPCLSRAHLSMQPRRPLTATHQPAGSLPRLAPRPSRHSDWRHAHAPAVASPMQADARVAARAGGGRGGGAARRTGRWRRRHGARGGWRRGWRGGRRDIGRRQPAAEAGKVALLRCQPPAPTPQLQAANSRPFPLPRLPLHRHPSAPRCPPSGHSGNVSSRRAVCTAAQRSGRPGAHQPRQPRCLAGLGALGPDRAAPRDRRLARCIRAAARGAQRHGRSGRRRWRRRGGGVRPAGRGAALPAGGGPARCVTQPVAQPRARLRPAAQTVGVASLLHCVRVRRVAGRRAAERFLPTAHVCPTGDRTPKQKVKVEVTHVRAASPCYVPVYVPHMHATRGRQMWSPQVPHSGALRRSAPVCHGLQPCAPRQ